ncbi:uncharacterized protein LOC122965463 [Thunnus albacares]|uniref:uncharacterized protein LOC122965463 n=1 Tax=Thunnus albacares TaxID=8236 RepID=UPI001CF63594|nr:uncharacterized protein LOC122965463 [Thunnus albacares]XP_044185497.1 uncharacterized protein LOC122965463 [Thunnus albacares]XP_044185498.1 uncharacterized protein LOC122965463 [Thunnus albacares]
MENGDTCSLKEQKMIDANTIWQWRIMLVKKYSKSPDPFYHCNKIGLDFNVGSSTQKKLDLKLLTNGVILEVCDFAKTVNKSKEHLIPNVLENKFDLRLESEQILTTRFRLKIRDLIKKPPKDEREAFPYFDTSSNPELNSNSRNGLNKASTECKTEGHLVEVDDNDDSEQEDKSKCSQAPSKKYRKTESLSEEIDGLHAADNELEDELKSSGEQSTEEIRDDVPPSSFPYCEEIGLNLDAGSKQSLDPGLLTKGVMLELLHLRKAVTAFYSPIVLAVLEHNFELDIKSIKAKNQIWFKISHLLRRSNANAVKNSQEFKNEPFTFETNPMKVHRKVQTNALSNMRVPLYGFKEVTKRRQSDLKSKQKKRALLTTNEQVTKRCRSGQSEHMETNNLQILNGHGYTCPLGESDLDSDKVTDSGNAGNQDHSQNSTRCSTLSPDVPRKSSYLGTHEPFLTTTDGSSSLPIVNSSANPLFASYPDKREPCRGEEQTQNPRNIIKKCDLEQEEMETENDMWKLRANRVKQILSVLDRSFQWSKKVGLDFNVGFGPKQNLSVESLTNSILLEVAKFALAMNSSQQDFIMEILEYNFDLEIQSKYLRSTFEHEIMTAVKQLKGCEDAVRFSKEVFELPRPMLSFIMANQSTDSVSTMDCDPPGSHAETKEHISQKSENLHPFCKEIGLRLHMNNHKPNEKLDIRKLTKGAVTEVTNFAEKLCGTFEQICLDILIHNFDFELQSGDSDLARDIVVQIPFVKDQRNLSNCAQSYRKLKRFKKDFPVMTKLDCQNNPSLDACTTGSSQASDLDRNVGSSIDIDRQSEDNKNLWKLRTDRVQRIFSMPHEEHCPLYSYSRCKKLGIDFNLGSGVKQNLDPNLLTNGVMVEVYTFATALQSARKHFITDILEYNFHLNLKDELYRVAFAQKIQTKIRVMNLSRKSSTPRMKMPFELPDSRCMEESHHARTTVCPKCYQDRNDDERLHQDESDPDHMHHPHPNAMTDAISASANCLAQKPTNDPSTAFPMMEETIMQSYPSCKKIGLSLCVNKDQPKDKLSTHVLTLGIMNEVAHFAQKLCGVSKNKIINEVLEHNFNFGFQNRDINPALQFCRMMTQTNRGLSWFSEVFVVQPCSHRVPGDVSKLKEVSAMQKTERKETTKKRKLALQTKKERASLLSQNKRVVKTRKHVQDRRPRFPVCKEIGLDLDVTLKSGDKEKLDLKLLTRAVVYEIHKFAAKRARQYFPRTVFDILDYNFDLSSQHYRRWEFSIAVASQIKTMVKQYWKKLDRAQEVFELPFVFDPKASQRFVKERQNKKSANTPLEEPNKKTNEQGRFVRQMRYCPNINRIRFLDNFKIEAPWFDEDTKSLTDSDAIMQVNGSTCSAGCDSHIQGNMQIKVEGYGTHYGDMKPEPDNGEKHHPHVKPESNTEDVKYLVSGDPAGSLGYTLTVCPNSESNIKTELDTDDVQYYILAEPQGPEGYTMLAVCPNTEGSFKTESYTEDVEYLVTVEGPGSPEYSVITICQDTENALIKEEQENVPADSYIQMVVSDLRQGVASYTENEVDIKQE